MTDPKGNASVIGCGHACHLMDVNVVKGYSHIHLHFLTDKQEYAELGYGKLELCCHSCGGSLLMYYTESPAQRRAQLKVRNDFEKTHRRCQRIRMTEHCSNWRSKFDFVDVRMSTEPQAQSWQKEATSSDKRVQRTS
jgi:hypothetical protein